jgi:hypothetical protein
MVNRGILQVLNLCLTYVFFLVGFLFLARANEIVAVSLGRSLLGGMTGFWLLRCLYQPIYFELRYSLSIVLCAVLAMGVAIHGYACLLATH